MVGETAPVAASRPKLSAPFGNAGNSNDAYGAESMAREKPVAAANCDGDGV